MFIDASGFLSLQTSDASKFIVAHSPSYVTFLPNAGAISSDEISNVIGLAMGFSSTKVGHFIQGMGILAHKILTWLITLQCLFSFV